MMILLLAYFFVVVLTTTGDIQEMKLILIEDEDAKCLDGSHPGYYISYGSGSGVNKWFIFHEGGGWCNSLDDCLFRSTTMFGSTINRVKSFVPYDKFSENPDKNMLMHNWNKIWIVYCDGGSFSGNRIVEHKNKTLYFKGQSILRAIKNSLPLKNATDVVISGCSAGGLSTYLNLDLWAHDLSAKVVGLPMDGFFLNLINDSIITDYTFYNNMVWIYENMNTAVKNVNLMFPENMIIKTPLFVLNSQYDEYDVQQVSNINAFGRLFLEKVKKLNSTLVENGVKINGFIDSCLRHCFGGPEINSINYTYAFYLFYHSLPMPKVASVNPSVDVPSSSSDTSPSTDVPQPYGFVIQNKPYPCWECCGSPIGFLGFLAILIGLMFIGMTALAAIVMTA